jgi:hypothetical protein
MNRREEWRKVLDQEVRRWSAMPYDDLIAGLRDHHAYEIEVDSNKYQVAVDVIEITEKYLHVAVAVDDGTLHVRPLSNSFFCPMN